MTAAEIGWHFPPTGGGNSHMWNHDGISHYGGAIDDSLAREAIQNSLDAPGPEDKPVQVEFEIKKINSEHFSVEQLKKTARDCLKGEDSENDPKAQRALNQIVKLLSEPELTCLRIADRGTTGANANGWRALVKLSGMSYKGSSTSQGSHGIGKNAAFLVSRLRTVFYYTRYANDARPSQIEERFQGKAIFATHINGKDHDQRQGTGYFGYVEGCDALAGKDIPEEIVLTERQHQGTTDAPTLGTSLWIAGFDDKHWQRRVAHSVVTNFFGAIQDGELSVTIDPDDDIESFFPNDIVPIDKNTISRWFDFLTGGKDSQSNGSDTNDDDDLADARVFWQMIRDDKPKERQFTDLGLGLCRLWIRVDDELTNKVALMRKSGMLITTEQKELIRFPGMRNFAALCRFDGDDGNELLKGMENPQHNQFSADWLPEDKRKHGKKVLTHIKNWIREEIRNAAGVPPSAERISVKALARLLPEIDPEDSFGDDGRGEGNEAEPNFEGGPVILLKPRRRPPATQIMGSDGDELARDDEGDDEIDVLISGGGGGGNRPKVEVKKAAPVRQRFPIENVRFVPIDPPQDSDQNLFYARVSFTSKGTGLVKIELAEAGDERLIPRHDVEARRLDGGPLTLADLVVSAGERVAFHIAARDPVDERAWIISVVKQDQRQ